METAARLAAAIESGGELASLLAALKDREREKVALRQQLDGLAGSRR